MSRTFASALGVVVAALGLLSGPLLAGQEAGAWTPLFNGKDLSGWVGVNVAPSTFTVKDGLIFCTGIPTGVMRTEKMYENFIVELEWRHLKPGGNAGFFVWSDAITSKGVPFTRSIEVQVLDGPNHPERRYTTHGDVFPIHGATMIPDNPFKSAKPGASGRSYPTEDRSKPSPQWNHYRIECREGNITLAVNGKVVTTGKNASPRKGYICLESEGGQVEWRNLRIQELPPGKDLGREQVAEEDQGYKSLYNGIDLDGFTVAQEGKAAWQPKDWILQFDPAKVKAEADSTLWLPGEHHGFRMIVDVRSKGPMQLISPAFGTIELNKPAGGDAAARVGNQSPWRRYHIHGQGQHIQVTGDDMRPIQVERRTPAGEGGIGSSAAPIGLKPTAAAEIGNLYFQKSAIGVGGAP